MQSQKENLEWTLYNKTVDISNFLNHHPGGDLALLLGAQRDCTKLFEQYHPNALKSRSVLMALTGIGIIPRRGHGFHEQLLKAAQELPSTKATWSHVIICGFLFIFTAVQYVQWWQGKWDSLLLLPIFHWLLGVNVAHDAAHFAFSHSPLINEYLALLSAPLLYNTAHWYMQHNVSHHEETNEVGKDLDVSHFSPLGRLHAKAKWKWIFNFQTPLIIAGFFGSTFAETLIFPFFARFKRRQLGEASVIEKRTRISSWFQILLGVFFLASPFWNFGYWKALAFSCIPFALSSIIFMSVTQISHVQEILQREKVPGLHWSRQQVQSSMDYSQDSWVTIFLTGGLNCQGLHHCLPFLSSSRFLNFYPTYRRICNENSVEIVQSKGFLDSTFQFWKYVHSLSKEKIKK